MIFEVIKAKVSLADLVARYTNMKRSGTHLKGCCPVHQESTPSFFVFADDHAHCYGCGFHGDVVDLWARMNGIQTGIEAALDLAREYGIQLPDRDLEVQKKADERRQKEADYARQTIACYQALSFYPNVVAYLEQRGLSEELQKRFLLGTNHDGSGVVIPFWHRGKIQSLIRRHLEREPKYLLQSANEFACGYRPLFIPHLALGDLHWVEGYIDALTIAALDLSVIAPGGTGISENQKAELERLSGIIYIFPDADEEGNKSARQHVIEFYPRARLCPAEYGEKADGSLCKDVADLFQVKGEESKDVLEGLKARSIDGLELVLSEAPKDSALTSYRYAKEKIIPLVLKLSDEGERHAALDDAAKVLRLKANELKKALKLEAQAREKAENLIEKDEEPEEIVPQPGSERYKQAMLLLSEQDLLERAAADLEGLGHVGEIRNKKLALICALSARAGRAIQPATHAPSSAGKNALWDAVLSLIPPESIVTRSALSSKALFRTQANLKGGILYIQEIAGSEEADYSIRILQSGGCLEYEATEKMPDGSMQNVVHKVEGPTVIVQTTTKNHLYHENATRVFPIYIDESAEQTERIIKRILKEAAGGTVDDEARESILQVWRDAIRLLEPAEVVIPYAEEIVMPNTVVRIRRDARRLIDVVRVIAWLHQHQRERDSRERIVATEADFHLALELVTESLSRAWQVLTPAEQRILNAIYELPEEKQMNGFKRRDLRLPGVSDRRLKEILNSLAENGYLDSDGRKGPQGYTYTVARTFEEMSLGIYLTAQSPGSSKATESKENISGGSHTPDSAHSPDYEALGVSGGNGRNGHRPVNYLSLEQLTSIGRLGILDRETDIPTLNIATQPKAVASTPFMITREMRQALADLRHSRNEIDRMTPQQEWEIINSNQSNGDAPKQSKVIEIALCSTCGREGVLFSNCAECDEFIRMRQ
jgi:DNA primase